MERYITCSIIGHRTIEITELLIKRLTFLFEDLIINHNVKVFLFGSKSQFNDLCLEIITNLKEKYPNIKRIYVRAEYPFIDKFYENYLLESYDETYFPTQITNAGKSAYVQRNKIMIDKSEYCVFYYNENYQPKQKIQNSFLPSKKAKSGTKIAFDYARKKQKKIINISDAPPFL